MKLFQYVKKGIEFFVNVPLFLQKGRNCKTVLVLSPQYVNYGDHLIAFSETEFFKKQYGISVLDLNYTFFDLWKTYAVKKVSTDAVVWVTGGGYIGDLWPESHQMVENVIDAFPFNKIVFAPQTTYYSDVESDEAKRFVQKVNDHGQCVFFAREKNTYALLKRMGISSVLAPDFGLLLQNDFALNDGADYISFCFREDQERLLSSAARTMLETALAEYQLPFHDVLMAKQHREIPAWSRKMFIHKKMREYAKSLVTVTDRLHCMVFCALTGTPCVVMDNKSKKISGVYEWMKGLSYVKLVNVPEEIPDAVKEVLAFSDKEENRKRCQMLTADLTKEFGPVFKEYIG